MPCCLNIQRGAFPVFRVVLRLTQTKYRLLQPVLLTSSWVCYSLVVPSFLSILKLVEKGEGSCGTTNMDSIASVTADAVLHCAVFPLNDVKKYLLIIVRSPFIKYFTLLRLCRIGHLRILIDSLCIRKRGTYYL